MTDLCIGLMSGTSLDAIDGALVEIGTSQARSLRFASKPMPADLRAELLALQVPGHDELHRAARAALALTHAYAEVVAQLLAEASEGQPPAIAVIGAHGQTVRHRPELGYTLQLLDGALLAELTGIPVACDFRNADIAAGGQGAPLVPAFHAGAFAHPAGRRAIVNIGGIANVSLLAPGEPVSGFDTGPGNMLLDHWCALHTGQAYDRNGEWAATGEVDATLLATFQAEPYFARKPPKSTGRDLFNAAWLDAALQVRARACRPCDVQATLVELTARSIADACEAFRADEVFICGGGAANGALMQRLVAVCAPASVASTAALGADPQSVEAVAFAWLAARRLRGEPGNLPEVTGARGPRVLGALYPAPRLTTARAP